LTKPAKLKLTKRHLQIFDIYEGKKISFERVGTIEEKKLFQNGEFKKITELINTDFKIKRKELSDSEIKLSGFSFAL